MKGSYAGCRFIVKPLIGPPGGYTTLMETMMACTETHRFAPPPDRRTRSRFMKLVRKVLIAAAIPSLLALGYGRVSGRTWYINIEGTGDLPTIQAAIDTAGVGDEIIVGPGHYTWSNQGTGDYRGFIRFYTRDHYVTLRSEMGPEATILDAEQRSRVIYCHGMIHVTVEGFTITKGNAPEWGDYCGGGFFTHIPGDCVRNCIFKYNRGGFGGALSCVINDGSFNIENCTFINNESTNHGGALGFANGTSTITVTGCVIKNNSASTEGGGIFQYNCPSIIKKCVIAGNLAGEKGSGVSAWTNSSITIIGCTICMNASTGAVASCINNTTISLYRSIIAFNTGPTFSVDPYVTASIGCCDIFGNTGGDIIPEGFEDTGFNIFLDPLFCGIPGSDNYYLRTNSPCLPVNHPDGLWCTVIGACPCGCGDIRTKESSWGGIKGIYR
jgi:hypothetical protein